MSKLLEVLENGCRALFGYESNYCTIEEAIDEELKKKTGKGIRAWSITGRIYGTVRLIESAKKSLAININHHDFDEIEVMNDSYVYSALYDAAKRGVNIDVVLTPEAIQKLSRDILGMTEAFIANTDFSSSIIMDGKFGKNVYSIDGKTLFWFC